MILDKIYDWAFEFAFEKIMQAKLRNAIVVIKPYWKNGLWVFDDPRTNLKEEPFVGGIPEIIACALEQANVAKEKAQAGFNLTFSAYEFPGAQLCLKKQEPQSDGVWYFWEEKNLRGWLCPALFHYYDNAPDKIWAKVEL